MVSQFPVLTLELARQIERNIAEGYTGGNRSSQANEIDVEQYGRAVAVKMPSSPWKNGVFCFSSDDVDRLEEIISFYEKDNADFSFYLTPMGFTEDVGRALTSAGMRPIDNSQALLYGLPATELESAAPDVTVESVTPDTLEIFTDTHVKGFEYPAAWHGKTKGDLHRQFGEDGFYPYLVRYQGEPVGSAYLEVRGGIGNLLGSATMPAFRGKGCHLALLRHRLHAAGELGCRLVVSGASFGSTSFRNQYRVGLRLAYIETIWKKAGGRAEG